MIENNYINKNPKFKKEDKDQRKPENGFPQKSLPEIEFVFDEKGNKIGENWIMN